MIYGLDGRGTRNARCCRSPTISLLPERLRSAQAGGWACQIEEHYSELAGQPTPMDIEWAKDGITGELFILQARPETVHATNRENYIESYKLTGERGAPLVFGNRGRRKDRSGSRARARTSRSSR